MVNLVQELARFARVEVEVDPEVTRQDEKFVIRVASDGATSTILLEDQKYVNAAPIVTFLNAVLDRRRARRRLHLFRGGGWSGGVLAAADAEAERLRVLGYIP